ncbi:MAG: histidine kinase [Gammaproteobacteria bacterium]|nr:histidine kinase [Gammaproteobacteria bacterium]MDH3412704.1 histidine kinase [Gammaproteobacteria bacterium]
MNGRPEAARLGSLPHAAGEAPSARELFASGASVGGRFDGKGFSGTGTLEPRLLVLSRCLLAFAALAILWVDPSGPLKLVEWTYASLAIYCVYSVVVAFVSYTAHWPAPNRALHWIDLCFFGLLVAVSGGMFLFYFAFFFYSILVASFAWGSREGVLVTLASVALFSVIGLNIAPALSHPEASGVLIRAVFLFVFGIIISDLGGYERLQRRRLGLLRDITNPLSPRFGVDHVNGLNLDRLLEFYGANSCVLVLRRSTPTPHYRMYSATRDRPSGSTTPSNVDAEGAGALLRLPDSLAVLYHDPAGPWWIRVRGYSAYDFDLGARTKGFSADCAAWANLLDTHNFVTVPYAQRDGTLGRLFVTSDRVGFNHADIEFLAQASNAMAMVVENMYLVEELAAQAVEHERATISRDLHDTTIQPYIGLKLALDALQREGGENNDLSPRIAELVAMAEMTIRDLRDYASTLKNKAAMPGEFLVAAVKKQAERLERFYGIRVEVKGAMSPRLQGRLAAEAFQIISEGLSNILRHTQAKNAFVTILCEETNLLLEIGNEVLAQEPPAKQFMPQSINERARMLGGKTFVEINAPAQTVVHVSIPI